ncbi:calcineurin-like phosphoesterase C-terminal domain-containing protein [Taibaiella chishuiensis]|uniref:Calcineurin-like phosphoesterase family protein n=1 Tax=Taibaiella chishuiensis TaxID=1434707 RepID=A0A2P8D7A5_9BACT|nr:calcineurin-like phosphoesterase family protein [Taibaiella chishuiensis]PSK93079.1 calcineurin-like phosphoesterase family protein [Taibaiella chishuiensis]
MQRRSFLRSLGLLSAGLALPAAPALARAVAFVTRQVNGKVTAQGRGIAGVAVSDGYSVVLTDQQGRYQLQPHYDARFVFISLPAGYEIPNEQGIARFYQPLDPAAAQQVADFALQAMKGGDERHSFIVWADPQMRNNGYDAEQFHTTSVPDTKAHVATLSHGPVFGIGCGDIAFDHFEVYEDYKKGVAAVGIPFFSLIGNHDMDYTARTDNGSQATFNQLFGPTYYSFNRGKVHYVVLDDVFFIGAGHRYIGYITEEQLRWLERDLKFVPAGSTVVVAMHIPSNTGAQAREALKEDPIGGVVMNRQALYKLLQPYKVQIISGHTHWNEVWEQDNITEHNLGTLCGAWWSGPVCGDGTPNGYGVFEVNGSDISWHYKATGFDRQHQMRLYKPGAVPGKPGSFMANVWNADERWAIEWLEDGVAKGAMTPYTGLDPLAVELYEGAEKPSRNKGVEPNITSHLFIATPSATARMLTVKATDRSGKVYEERLMLNA